MEGQSKRRKKFCKYQSGIKKKKKKANKLWPVLLKKNCAWFTFHLSVLTCFWWYYIRMPWIGDSQCAYSVIFCTCCTQFNLTITIVVVTSMAWFSISASSRLGSPWGDQFCLALSDHFQSLLVPQCILSTFHDELEPRLIGCGDFFIFTEAISFLL